jgi:hypothetical protein
MIQFCILEHANFRILEKTHVYVFIIHAPFIFSVEEKVFDKNLNIAKFFCKDLLLLWPCTLPPHVPPFCSDVISLKHAQWK